MAKIDSKRFVPTPEEQTKGVTAMTEAQVIDALAAYKLQNPVKYEAKKAALFARYNLKQEAIPEPQPDENDLELAALKASAKKK